MDVRDSTDGHDNKVWWCDKKVTCENVYGWAFSKNEGINPRIPSIEKEIGGL